MSKETVGGVLAVALTIAALIFVFYNAPTAEDFARQDLERMRLINETNAQLRDECEHYGMDAKLGRNGYVMCEPRL